MVSWSSYQCRKVEIQRGFVHDQIYHFWDRQASRQIARDINKCPFKLVRPNGNENCTCIELNWAKLLWNTPRDQPWVIQLHNNYLFLHISLLSSIENQCPGLYTFPWSLTFLICIGKCWMRHSCLFARIIRIICLKNKDLVRFLFILVIPTMIWTGLDSILNSFFFCCFIRHCNQVAFGNLRGNSKRIS